MPQREQVAAVWAGAADVTNPVPVGIPEGTVGVGLLDSAGTGGEGGGTAHHQQNDGDENGNARWFHNAFLLAWFGVSAFYQ